MFGFCLAAPLMFVPSEKNTVFPSGNHIRTHKPPGNEFPEPIFNPTGRQAIYGQREARRKEQAGIGLETTVVIRNGRQSPEEPLGFSGKFVEGGGRSTAFPDDSVRHPTEPIA